MKHTNLSLTALLVVVLAPVMACVARAQEPAGPSEEDSAEAELLVPRVPGEIESFSPVRRRGTSPVRPGLTGGEPWTAMIGGDDASVDAGPQIAERTFLNRVRGAVVSGPHGTRIFVPGDSDAAALGPVLLLPCGVLERFDEFAFKGNTRVPALVSGRVFLYADRVYVLPTALLAATDAGTDAGPADAGDAASASNPEVDSDALPEPGSVDATRGDETEIEDDELNDGPAVTQGDVDALIEELERRPVYSRRGAVSAPSRARPNTGDDDSETEDAGAPPSARTERYISSQRGRMVRSPEGSWLFATDTDDGAGLRLTLLPCRMLEALEEDALRDADNAAVVISGRVVRYYDREYLLPTLFQRERRDGVDPLQ